MRLPFATSSYRHRDLPISAQRLINWHVEVQPQDAKSRLALLPTPGLDRFALLATGPMRGMHRMRGFLYAVSGTGVYQVTDTGSVTFCGNVADGALVSLADNGTELIIVVPETGQGWVVEGATLTQITDGDFLSATSVTVMDGYAIFTRTDTSNFFISDLNDAMAYTASQIATAERSPDNLVVARRVGGELWLFGTETTEVWRNTGSADFPFEQSTGAFISKGCGARFSVQDIDGVPLWLGQDRVVYAASGLSPQRISTHAIEQAIAGFETVANAEGWTYTLEGHRFYGLHFPDEGLTFVCDIAAGNAWHERASEGYDGWRCRCVTEFAGGVIGGDRIDGRLYVVNPTANSEDGTEIVRAATSPCQHGEGKRLFHMSLRLDCVTGNAPLSGQGSDPKIWLSISDDGGRTFSNEIWRGLGARGKYRHQVRFNRLGASRERVYRLQMSDPVRTTIIAADFEAQAAQT